MRNPILPLLALLTLLVPAPVLADDAPKTGDLVAQVTAFLNTQDDGERAVRGMGIAGTHPDAHAVADAVAQARRGVADAPKDKVATWRRATADGVQHTIFANIPPQYDAAKAWPVLIWLHGGVSREQDGGGASGMRAFSEASDEHGFILLSPSTQKGAEWWTPNGVALIRGALLDLGRTWRVDADRVAVGGFSDGASGCFHLLAHDPEPYCCFLPLMAHPGVTRLAGGPTFPANVRSRPVLAFQGGQDVLYPSARMKPLITELEKAGCDLTWVDLPEAGHNLGHVLPEHLDRVLAFWNEHPRVATPTAVQWQTAVPGREGRLDFVEILAVDPKAPAGRTDGLEPLPDPAGRPRLGVRLDRTHPGPGLKLESVEEGTAAAEAGFEAGDIITKVDGTELGAAQAAMMVLVRVLPTLTDRDGVFEVKRGDETLTLKARPRAVGGGSVKRPASPGYGVPSGRVEVRSAGGNRFVVNSHHVRRFRLHLTAATVDLSKPITVVVNEKPAFEGKATTTTTYVLEQAARQVGGPVYRAYVDVTP